MTNAAVVTDALALIRRLAHPPKQPGVALSDLRPRRTRDRLVLIKLTTVLVGGVQRDAGQTRDLGLRQALVRNRQAQKHLVNYTPTQRLALKLAALGGVAAVEPHSIILHIAHAAHDTWPSSDRLQPFDSPHLSLQHSYHLDLGTTLGHDRQECPHSVWASV